MSRVANWTSKNQKYMAYRGLCLSSCHCFENYVPKIVVVPDLMRTIKNQNIKYVYDKTTTFIDRDTGKEREWTQKDIAQDVRDIEINAFDGCGICHPAIMREIEQQIKTTERMNSFILRAPYMKGCVHEMDYEQFYAERGVNKIVDIWGVEHSVAAGAEPMIILTEGQYKGYKYFKKTGTVEDWHHYWDMFKKYKHCIGVAKWNFTLEQEPLRTRVNYQVLQDLDLPFESFARLADESVNWYEKIVRGDTVYTYCFLGLLYDSYDPMNNYTAAILRNPEMLQEPSVKEYIRSLLDKYRNEFKCGKLWMNATFKFLAPDLIALMEHIGGLEVNGCLEADEFFTMDRRGKTEGERLIERNPHICRSEHTILNAVNNEYTDKYCGHLQNVAMINIKSITAQRLNGADYDGDLVLVINNDIMKSGVDRTAPIVIDIEDKVTAISEPIDTDHMVAYTLRSLKSMIGEISNYATCYHNRVAATEKTQHEYESYIDLLSICNGERFAVVKPR